MHASIRSRRSGEELSDRRTEWTAARRREPGPACMFLGGPGGRFSEPRRASVRNEARRRLEDRQRDLSDLLKEAGVDPLRQGCPGRALEEAVAGSALRNRLPGRTGRSWVRPASLMSWHLRRSGPDEWPINIPLTGFAGKTKPRLYRSKPIKTGFRCWCTPRDSNPEPID